MSRYFESLINRSSVRLSGDPEKETGHPVSRGEALLSAPVDIGEHTFIDSHNEHQQDQGGLRDTVVEHADANHLGEKTTSQQHQRANNLNLKKPTNLRRENSFSGQTGLPEVASESVGQNKTRVTNANRIEHSLPSRSFEDTHHDATLRNQDEKRTDAKRMNEMEQHSITEKQAQPIMRSQSSQSVKKGSIKQSLINKQGKASNQKPGMIEAIVRKTEANEPVVRSEKEVLSNYIINQVQTWVQEDSDPVRPDSSQHPKQEMVPSLESPSSIGPRPLQHTGQERQQEAVRLIETDNQLSIGHIDITIEAPAAEQKQQQSQPVAQVPSKQESQSFLNWQRHYQTI